MILHLFVILLTDIIKLFYSIIALKLILLYLQNVLFK